MKWKTTIEKHSLCVCVRAEETREARQLCSQFDFDFDAMQQHQQWKRWKDVAIGRLTIHTPHSQTHIRHFSVP